MVSKTPPVFIIEYLSESPNELIKEFAEILKHVKDVKSLEKIKPKLRELFTNDAHTQYVLNVLKYMKKRDVKVFAKVLNNYILIRTERTVDTASVQRTVTRCYVIGVNDDGKLFINRVDDNLYIDCQSDRDVVEYLVPVYGFGAGYSKYKSERIQGDLCFTYRIYSSFEEALREIPYFTDTLCIELTEFSVERIIRYLCIELSKLGIDAEIITDNRRNMSQLGVALPRTSRRRLEKYCIALGLEIDELLRDILPNYLALVLGRHSIEHIATVLDADMVFIQRYKAPDLEIYGNVAYRLNIHYPIDLDACEILVTLHLNDFLNSVISSDLFIHLDEHLGRIEVPIRDLTVNIGNHVLEFRGTDRVVYRFKLGTEDIELAIPLRGYLVTSDVTVTHHEHGVAKFKISGVAHVIPHTTAVHEMHRIEMNKASLDVILSDRIDQVNKLYSTNKEMILITED